MDEEEKKMRKLASEADDKEESYYRKAMEKKAEQSRVAQLQAPPKRGKKSPISEKAVDLAVEKRKAAASKFPRGVEIDEDELESREFRKEQERRRELGLGQRWLDYYEKEYKGKEHRKRNPVPKLSQVEEDLVEQYDELHSRMGHHRAGGHDLYYMWQESAEWEKGIGRGDIRGDGNTFESYLKTLLKYGLKEAFPAGSDFRERPKFTLMRDLAKGHKGVPDDPTIDQKTGLAKPVGVAPSTPSRVWLLKKSDPYEHKLARPDWLDPEKKVPFL